MVVNVLVGIIGLYLVVVGIGGNGVEFIDWASHQSQFLAWVVVSLVLVALLDHASTHELGLVFTSLIIIGYIVTHYQTVMESFTSASQATGITGHAAGNAISTTAGHAAGNASTAS